MGFFDFIGDAVTGIVSPILSPVTSILGAVGGIANSANQVQSFVGKDPSSRAIQSQIDMQRTTNAMSAEEAQRNRDFTERLSSTAHQREVVDLRAAGLNPILSVNHSGSSTPGGSQASFVSPGVGTAEARNSARRLNEVESARLRLETALNEAQLQNMESQRMLNEQLTNESRNKANKASAEAMSAAYDAQTKDAYLQYKFPLEVQNILKQGKLIDSQGIRELSQARSNSAYSENLNRRSKLLDYDIKAGEYSSEIRPYTEAAKEVFGTINEGEDMFNLPKKIIHR